MPRMHMLWIVALSLAGCGTQMDLPAGFVPVDRADLGDFDQRAVSADGVVLSVSHRENVENGTLSFWAEAIRLQLAESKGYAAGDSKDITSAGGLPGKLMSFSLSRTGVGYTYLVALFVDRTRVITSEAGGPSDKLDARRADIEKALSSVR